MKTALTIAGSDPTGGAGLQADLKVFRAMGVYGLSVPAVLTAQNTEAIDYIYPVPGDLFYRQLDFLLGDIKPDALKTGMLYSTYAVEITAEIIDKYHLENLVVDPVTVSSSGSILVMEGALDSIKALLFPRAKCITPNIYEASVFTGINIDTESNLEDAARRLKDMGPETVVITGGHLEDRAVDLFYDGKVFERIGSEKLDGEYHGTGCAFSAAMTAMLCMGQTPLEAASSAKEFVVNAIKNAHRPGKGMGLLDL